VLSSPVVWWTFCQSSQCIHSTKSTFPRYCVSFVYQSLVTQAGKSAKSLILQLGGVDLPIRKIAEKYARNPEVSAEEDIRKVSVVKHHPNSFNAIMQ
jgi:hypothetical protein